MTGEMLNHTWHRLAPATAPPCKTCDKPAWLHALESPSNPQWGARVWLECGVCGKATDGSFDLRRELASWKIKNGALQPVKYPSNDVR